MGVSTRFQYKMRFIHLCLFINLTKSFNLESLTRQKRGTSANCDKVCVTINTSDHQGAGGALQVVIYDADDRIINFKPMQAYHTSDPVLQYCNNSIDKIVLTNWNNSAWTGRLLILKTDNTASPRFKQNGNSYIDVCVEKHDRGKYPCTGSHKSQSGMYTLKLQ